MDVLSHLTKKLIAITKRSLADLTGRAVIEQTVCVLVLAQGMVMAGSGDLGVMRTCRMLRARVHNNNTVTYGSHMAVHLALGLLFLGGGKLGLANSPEAVAAMICAFYPKFPTHSSDNRYHLQALRHLYALAVEPRVLVPRSSETGSIVKCGVELQYCDQPQYRGLRLEVSSPVLLPALSLLSSVSISDQSHWTTVFRSQDVHGWDNLNKILASNGDLAVKRKSGAGLSPGLQWSLGKDQLSRLSSGPGRVSTYLSLYLSGCPDTWTTGLQCVLSSCLASTTPDMLPVWTSLLSPLTSLDMAGCFQVASQIQTLMTLARNSKGGNHVNPEMAMSLSQKTNHIMDRVSSEMRGQPLKGSSLSFRNSTENQESLKRLGEESIDQYNSEGIFTLSTGIREYLCAKKHGPGLNPAQRQAVASTMKLHSLPSPQDNEEMSNEDIRIKQNPLKLAKILRNSSNPASLYRMLQL